MPAGRMFSDALCIKRLQRTRGTVRRDCPCDGRGQAPRRRGGKGVGDQARRPLPRRWQVQPTSHPVWFTGSCTSSLRVIPPPSRPGKMTPHHITMRGTVMIPHHVYCQLAILGLLWLCVMLSYLWPSQGVLAPQPPAQPVLPKVKRKRSNAPKDGLVRHQSRPPRDGSAPPVWYDDVCASCSRCKACHGCLSLCAESSHCI